MVNRNAREWALERPLEELAVELTVYCNLQCRMCSVWEIKEHGVPNALARQLLADAYALGARRFTPCGAESFMRKDFVELVEYADSLGYTSQEIVTNGTMITAAHFDRLEKVPSARFHISIDGPKEIQDDLRGEGVYDKCVATATEMVRRGISVGLSGVIMRETLPRLTELVDLAVTLGIDEVSYQPFQLEISGPQKDIPRFSLLRPQRSELVERLDHLRGYARQRGVRIYTESLFDVVPDYLLAGKRPIPKGGCFLPSKFLLVNYTGEVYPCFFMREQSMGNVYKTGLPEMWHGVVQRELNALALDEKCPGCLAACSDVEAFAAAGGQGVAAPPSSAPRLEAR
jgi:MoaA/NifB/PqqE/SkfB family radical SAM enzyme